MFNGLNKDKILNNEPAKGESFKTTFGPENTYYDIAPILTLEEKKADVSSYYDGALIKREADIYRDQNGNAWFEITKSPRKQMMISLLSQPFFNVATVVEIPEKELKISKFFSKINPKLALLFKKSPKFISKGMDLEKVESKTRSQMIGDYLVFDSIFDRGVGDRNFSKQENIHYRGSGYSLFDFDSSGITPNKYFAESKSPQGYFNSAPDDGMKEYFMKIRDIVSGGSDRNPNWLKTKVPFSAIEETVKKFKEVKEFFSGEKGEQFMKAVLEKTKYADEYRMGNKKHAKNNPIDESYIDPSELTKGLLAQTIYSANVLLSELKKERNKYIEEQTDKDEITKKYDFLLEELEELVNDEESNHLK